MKVDATRLSLGIVGTYDLEEDDLENDDLENNDLGNDDLENDDSDGVARRIKGKRGTEGGK